MAEIKRVVRKTFLREVMKAEEPVVVTFIGEWAPESKLEEAIIEELAEANKGRIKFVYIDVDEEPTITARYNILQVPSILVFYQGNIVNISHGFTKKSDLEMMIL